jgi:hypothetical protein
VACKPIHPSLAIKTFQRREEEEARRSERVVRGKTEEVNEWIREARASWLCRIVWARPASFGRPDSILSVSSMDI